MLKLGFNSAILGDFGFEHVVQFAGNHGFSCVEMMCWPSDNADSRRYAGVTHIDVNNLTLERISLIKHTLKEANVTISALGYYPNPLDPDEERSGYYIEHIKQVIRGAAKLNIPVVTTFIGRNPAKSIKENLARFADVWPAIVKVAEEENVKIGIENCPMFFTDDEWPGGKNLAISPAVWDRMFEIIPSPIFGLNYDPSHMIWQMMSETRPIYDYKDRLHHIHLKDAKIYKDKLDRVGIMANPLEYHSPKLPGLGDVNWRAFFAALTDVRYRGPVVIEVEDKAYEGSITDVQSAILTSRNYLRQFLG
ncbi:sugar phosphate isomerase/epimerase family protein [Dyadobacter fanqingshengii]|uniref:Sugar phosphate isomerase/epimerase n=1 Tax=Dyadobacter fanqingshengii TaxID=2906443 RepID=A0A9X1PBB2_9BACT|nr:sugar phosphate isomerase/epimerase family protein [Dyadobacter fanqingshengii]MCF0041084.1 sugar phosphate isomerase/epimerase [Dyadobacter fanqingshengii]USJ37189.1 sugar phosphate isomerase/epimerase [Dyadobacter fanqingshengii]